MLPDLCDLFVRDVTAGKTNETPKAYRGKLNHLIHFCQGANLDQELVDNFRRFLLERKEHYRGKQLVKGPLSPFTIRSILTTVNHFLRWGADRHHWPVIHLSNIPEPPVQPKAVSADTFARLVRAAGEVGEDWERIRNLAILYVLRDSGCRVGAVARVDVGEVDLVKGVMQAMDKGNQLSWIYIIEPTIEAVGNWLVVRQQLLPEDYLLWTGEKRRGLTTQGIRRMIHRLAAAAELKGVRCNPHSFRHAFARDALRAGADLSQVSQLLHHSSIGVTAKYYARWDDRELREVHKRVSPMRKA